MINVKELISICQDFSTTIKEAQAIKLFSEADTNKDGFIDLEEFKIVAQTYWCTIFGVGCIFNLAISIFVLKKIIHNLISGPFHDFISSCSNHLETFSSNVNLSSWTFKAWDMIKNWGWSHCKTKSLRCPGNWKVMMSKLC